MRREDPRWDARHPGVDASGTKQFCVSQTGTATTRSSRTLARSCKGDHDQAPRARVGGIALARQRPGSPAGDRRMGQRRRRRKIRYRIVTAGNSAVRPALSSTAESSPDSNRCGKSVARTIAVGAPHRATSAAVHGRIEAPKPAVTKGEQMNNPDTIAHAAARQPIHAAQQDVTAGQRISTSSRVSRAAPPGRIEAPKPDLTKGEHTRRHKYSRFVFIGLRLALCPSPMLYDSYFTAV